MLLLYPTKLMSVNVNVYMYMGLSWILRLPSSIFRPPWYQDGGPFNFLKVAHRCRRSRQSCRLAATSCTTENPHVTHKALFSMGYFWNRDSQTVYTTPPYKYEYSELVIVKNHTQNSVKNIAFDFSWQCSVWLETMSQVHWVRKFSPPYSAFPHYFRVVYLTDYAQ